jgi:hypothetical protein
MNGEVNKEMKWKTPDSRNNRETSFCQSLTLMRRNKEMHSQTRRMGRGGLAVVNSWESSCVRYRTEGRRPIVGPEPSRKARRGFGYGGVGQGVAACQSR